MARPSKYPPELRERAVRMVLEFRADDSSEYEAIRSIAGKLGIVSPESLRKCDTPVVRHKPRRRLAGAGSPQPVIPAT